MKIATLQLFLISFIFSLSACSTPYKKYAPPDATKLKASVAKLNTAIKKSHNTAAKAKIKVEEAQKSANAALLDSFDIDKKLEELSKQAPPELQPLIKEVQDVRKTQQANENQLQKNLLAAHQEHEQLAKDNIAVTTAESEVKRYGGEFFVGVQTLADAATKEREFRRKAEAENLKMKIFKWLGGGAIVLFILLTIGVFIAWKTGKFAIWGAKAYAKI